MPTSSKRLTPRLAVIVHADVAGSTALVHRDEALAHERIRDVFQRLSEVVTSYGGTPREVRGDALLADFERASDAVSACLSFQAENTRRNEGLDDAVRPEVRVGISLGEVVIADGTLTGPEVIFAQRIEQLAPPGGICVSAAVRQALPRRLPFAFDALDARMLKGFDEPVTAHLVRLEGGAALPPPRRHAGAASARRPRWLGLAAGAAAAAVLGAAALVWWLPPWRSPPPQPPVPGIASPDGPSIAVLPFDNLSDDPSQGYFADGIVEDLITDLSKISGLLVTARNSSFAYRGRVGDLKTVARELGVRYLLEGSVRRAGSHVRINAQLIDAASNAHVWADRYDRELTDVFAIQDEVTRSIVSALEVSLSGTERQRLGHRRAGSFDAYDVLLRAREIQARFTPEDNAEGRRLFEKAAELDPEYARAYASVSLTHSIDINMNWTPDRERSLRLGKEAAERALALDDTLPRAHFAKASLHMAQGQYAEAMEVARRAVDLSPSYADGHAQLGFYLINAGSHEEGLAAMLRAKRLNPHYTQLYLWVEAMGRFFLGQYERTLALLLEARDRNPAFDRVHVMLAATHGHLGNADEASWALDEARVLLPDLSIESERRGSVVARDEDRDRLLEGLQKAGLE